MTEEPKLTTVKVLDSSKTSGKKFCIFSRGGLGDIIRRYFGIGVNGDGWEYLSAIKSRYPDSVIKLITLSANSQAPILFKYHPLIDCIYSGEWSNPWHACPDINKIKGDYTLIKVPEANMNYTPDHKIVSNLNIVPQSEFYHGKKDQEQINHITSQGKYVVLHPFAGTTDRSTLVPIKEYFPLVKRIINDTGLNVVVFGANWNKRGINKSEQFPMKHPKLISMIDKTNARVAIRLIFNATYLITLRSYCFSAAMSGRVQTSLLVGGNYMTPNATQKNLLQWGWDKEILRRKINMIGVDANFDLMRLNVLDDLKNYITT